MNRLFCFVAALFLGGMGIAQDVHPLSDQDISKIRALLTRYEADWNHHDMLAVGDLFTSDAEWINVVGMHWRGKSDITKAHVVFGKRLFSHTGIRFTSIHIRAIAPKVAIAVVNEQFEKSDLPDGGTRPASEDVLSFILVNRDGDWKIAHGHNTIVNPDAAPFDPRQQELGRGSAHEEVTHVPIRRPIPPGRRRRAPG